MNLRAITPAFLLLASGVVSGSQVPAEKLRIIAVSGPTVVAFYAFDQTHPVAAEANAESDETLGDFQFYAAKDRDLLRLRGIQFQEVYALSFQIQIGNRKWLVKADQFKCGVGYYFIAPGKQPHIENGVMTDEDLRQVADRFFESSKTK